MKAGDLVRVPEELQGTYDHQKEIGLVVRVASNAFGMLILWPKGLLLFGRPDLLEVVNESR